MIIKLLSHLEAMSLEKAVTKYSSNQDRVKELEQYRNVQSPFIETGDRFRKWLRERESGCGLVWGRTNYCCLAGVDPEVLITLPLRSGISPFYFRFKVTKTGLLPFQKWMHISVI